MLNKGSHTELRGEASPEAEADIKQARQDCDRYREKET